MTFVDLLAALRRRWLWVVAGLLVGIGVAALVSALLPRTYESTASLYVSASDPTTAQTAYQGTLLSQQRVKSYTQIVTSDRVLRPVLDGIGTGGTTAGLAGQVVVASDEDSTVLRISVEDGSPEQAAALANLISARFTAVVAELEAPRAAGGQSPVTVLPIDVAVPVSQPVTPRWELNLVVGAVLGLVLAAAAAAVRAATDRTVHSTEELAALVVKPVLGTLVEDRAVEGTPLFLRDRPSSPAAENMRAIQTNFDMFDLDREAKVFVVTSSVENEGKSSIAANLALAQANSGRRVLVIEADLRKPHLAMNLGRTSAVGLTQVLPGRAELDDVIQSIAPRLDLLASGPLPPNPYEMLQSEQMTDLLASLYENYDLILLDAPPLLPVADSLALARIANGVVFVVRASATQTAQVSRAYGMLEQAGVSNVGLVLNRVTARGGAYYSSYYAANPEAVAAAKEQDAPREEPATDRSDPYVRIPSPTPRSEADRVGGATGGSSSYRLLQESERTPSGRNGS